MLFVSAAMFAQAPAPAEAPKPANRIIGEVTAKDGNQITVKADSGTVYTVGFADATTFVRMTPGETNLAKGTKITAADVNAGDRVMARGDISEADKRIASARQIVVMTKTDLAQKHERDRAEWQRRGITGVVTSVDTAAQKITVTSGTGQAQKTVTLLASNNTGFRRYAPGSIRWEDAKPSTLADVKIGDRVRALGDKSADGSEFTAQEVISGSFTTVAGTVASIDAAKNEIRLTDVNTKKPITITINPEQSALKRLPPMMANVLARQLNPTYKAAGGDGEGPSGGMGAGMGQGGQRGAGGGAPGSTAAAGAAQSGGAQRLGNQQGGGQWAGGQSGPGGQGAPGGAAGFGRPGGGPPDLSRMLERMPNFTLAELKPGDALIVNSAAEGQDASRLTAITILAGVEPILVAAPRTFGQGGGIASWNLDTQMPGQ